MGNNTELQPLALDHWDESLSHIKEDMNGLPLNIHSLMANHPEFIKAWWGFRNYTVHKGDLSPREKELIILRVAFHMKTWYEWAAHVTRGLECGLSVNEIERVHQGGEAAGWTDSESILLTALDELVEQHHLTKETLSRMHHHYSNKQIMDLIAIHGVYVIIACMINTWGLDLDEQFEEKLPATMSKEKFETR